MSVERYTQSVGISPQSIQGAGDTQMATSKMFGKIGDSLLNMANKESELDLKKAQKGAAADALVSIDQQKQQVSNKAYDEGFNSIQEVQAQMQAKNNIAQMAGKYFNDGITQDTFQQFNDDVKNFKGALSQSLPEGTHAPVNKMVDYYATNATKSMAGQYDAQTENQAKSIFYDAMTSSNEDINNAYMQGDEHNGTVLAAQSVKNLKSLVTAGIISPAAFAKAANDVTTNAQNSYYFGQASQALQSGKIQEWQANFSKSLHGLTENQHYRIMRHVKGMVNAQTQLDSLNRQAMNDQLKKNVKFLEETGNSNATLPFQEKIISDPKLAQKWQQQSENALTYHSIMTEVNNSSPMQAQDILNDLHSDMQKSINNPGEYINKQELLQKVEKTYNAQQEQFKKDPASIVEQSPQFAGAVREAAASTTDTFGNTVSSGVTTTDLDQTKINMYQQRGLPRSEWRILPNKEASAFVSSVQDLPLSSADPAQPSQLNEINKLLAQHPDTQKMVLADLHKAGLPIATNLFMNLPDTASASQMQNVSNAWSKAGKSLPLPAGITQSLLITSLQTDPTWKSYSESLGSTASVQDIKNVQNEAYLLARYYSTPEGGGMTESTAISTATKTLFGNVYNFGSQNGSEYRIPKQLNEQAVESTAKSTFNNLLSQNVSGKVKFVIPPSYESQLNGLTPQQQQSAYASTLSSSARWVNAQDNSGLVLIDQNGVPVKEAVSGQPVMASWAELNDPKNIHTFTDSLHQAKDNLLLPFSGEQVVDNFKAMQ